MSPRHSSTGFCGTFNETSNSDTATDAVTPPDQAYDDYLDRRTKIPDLSEQGIPKSPELTYKQFIALFFPSHKATTHRVEPESELTSTAATAAGPTNQVFNLDLPTYTTLPGALHAYQEYVLQRKKISTPLDPDQSTADTPPITCEEFLTHFYKPPYNSDTTTAQAKSDPIPIPRISPAASTSTSLSSMMSPENKPRKTLIVHSAKKRMIVAKSQNSAARLIKLSSTRLNNRLRNTPNGKSILETVVVDGETTEYELRGFNKGDFFPDGHRDEDGWVYPKDGEDLSGMSWVLRRWNGPNWGRV